MNCPGCNRNNAFNLSICPSCGAMTNDTVREILLPKISKPMKIEVKDKNSVSGKLNLSPIAAATATKGKEMTIAAEKEIQPKTPTVSAVAAPKKIISEPPAFEVAAAKPTAVSPNLVEFHSKNSSVPEWRLQLQNAVRRRCDRETAAALTKNLDAPAAAPRRTQLVTSGANALKAEIVAEKQPTRVKNPTLNSALERIEKSRQKFLAAEAEAVAELSASASSATASAPRPASKNFPFYIAPKQTEVAAKTAEPNAPAAFSAARPKLAESSSASIGTESGDLDTNKLPPLPLLSAAARLAPANLAKNPAAAAPEIAAKAESKNLIAEEKPKIESKLLEQNKIAADDETIEGEEFEDCAPYSMRFNAGVFDLIIGGFSSLLVLSPFMLTGENWFTFTGLLAFLATCSIVMFIYLTATIGYYGRTFGMRLFALEIVDIEGEHYPTLHQAAVSSAVYILSLALGGIGFLTLPFNEDRRAAHDLASGTIVVREN